MSVSTGWNEEPPKFYFIWDRQCYCWPPLRSGPIEVLRTCIWQSSVGAFWKTVCLIRYLISVHFHLVTSKEPTMLCEMIVYGISIKPDLNQAWSQYPSSSATMQSQFRAFLIFYNFKELVRIFKYLISFTILQLLSIFNASQSLTEIQNKVHTTSKTILYFFHPSISYGGARPL